MRALVLAFAVVLLLALTPSASGARSLDDRATTFVATGIPVTPFPDATPTTEDAHQQALVIARDLDGVVPSGDGPHGMRVAGVAEDEVLAGARPLEVSPNPMRGACTMRMRVGAPRPASPS